MIVKIFKKICSKLYGKSEEPAILFLGDIHSSLEVGKKNLEKIKKYKPELILYEGLSGAEIEEGEKIKEFFRSATLEEIARELNLNLDELLGEYLKNYEPEKYKREYSIIDELLGLPEVNVIPENKEELVKTPLYKLDLNILLDIYENLMKKYAETNKEDVIKISKKIESFIKLVNEKLEKLIYPRSVLDCELFRLSNDIGAKIAGCDPSVKKQYILNAKNFEEVLSYLSNERINEDEIKMAERITKIIETYKPKKVAVIVGKKHLRKDSKLLEEIRKKNVKYRTYIPKYKEDATRIVAEEYAYRSYLFPNNEEIANSLFKKLN